MTVDRILGILDGYLMILPTKKLKKTGMKKLNINIDV